MRDYLVLAIVIVSAPLALFSPYYGVLVWTWLSYFNPHRYAWGVAREFPVALMIAVPTLIGCLFTSKNRRIFERETVLLALLWAWLVFTTVYIGSVPAFGGHVADAKSQLAEVSKILLMTFLTIVVVNSRQKLRILVFVIALSFGFRALIAAVFVIRTGGEFRVWGPAGTFVADNNDFGLALNMTIPLLFFLARAERSRWVRFVLRMLMICTIISVIGTFSRGGMLGLGIVILALAVKSRHKFVTACVVFAGLAFVVSFSSAEWKNRMLDFAHGNLDLSAQTRLMTWKAGLNLVADYPLTGGGFEVYPDASLMMRYMPGATLETDFKGPHSIYFQMLGEQGLIGLGLFAALLGAGYVTVRKLRRQAMGKVELAWIVPYTHMFEVSLLAYIVSGATLGRAYFDFMYQVLACIVLLKILVRSQLREAMAVDTAIGSTVAEEAVAV